MLASFICFVVFDAVCCVMCLSGLIKVCSLTPVNVRCSTLTCTTWNDMKSLIRAIHCQSADERRVNVHCSRNDRRRLWPAHWDETVMRHALMWCWVDHTEARVNAGCRQFGSLNCNPATNLLQAESIAIELTLWRPLLPYGYNYKASCAMHMGLSRH